MSHSLWWKNLRRRYCWIEELDWNPHRVDFFEDMVSSKIDCPFGLFSVFYPTRFFLFDKVITWWKSNSCDIPNITEFRNQPTQEPVLASSSPTFWQVIPSVWSLSEQSWYRRRFSWPQSHVGKLSGLLFPTPKISVRWNEVCDGQWQFHDVHGIGWGHTSTHSWKSVSITLYG